MKEFSGKVAVITGGASGMGRGTAIALAKRGVNLSLADLNEERGAATVAELEAMGVKATFTRCNVTSDADVAELHARTIAAFGRVDIVMNNAGILPVGTIIDMPMGEWERTFQVNLLAYVRVTKAFLKDVLAAKGHLVFTASLAALFGYDFRTLAYNSSKAAVVALAEGLYLMLRPQNVGVTCLCPGPVVTNIGEQIAMHGEAAPIGVYASTHVATRTSEEVGEQVVDAIIRNQFLLHTDDSVQGVLRNRADDMEGALAEMLAFMAATA